MKALITGANGHIGCHLVRACLEAGVTPVAFVRERSDLRGLAGLDVELRKGDLLDAASLERAVQGVNWVFHAAAVHRNWGASDAELMDPAIVGTRNVIAAARKGGASRVVHTSTGATVGFASDVARPLDETAPVPSAKSVYVRAKLEAEKVALAANGADLEVVVVNPSGVFGPRDYRLTPATRGLRSMLQGDPVMFGLCVTDVRDVARGHVLAAQRGVAGERYLLTGEPHAPGQLAQLFQQTCGVRSKAMTPPRFLLRLLASMEERKARKSGLDAAVTRDQVDDVYGRHLVYDASKARGQLDASFRPAAQTLRDAARWLLFADALGARTVKRLRATLADSAAPDPDWQAR